MHTKVLLAAAAMLASVGMAQAQGQAAADTLVFPSQDRATDSVPDNEDGIRFYMRRHFPSDSSTPVQADEAPVPQFNFTSEADEGAPAFLFPSQDRDTDSTPD